MENKEFLEYIKNNVEAVKEHHLTDERMVIFCDEIISYLEDDRLWTNPSPLDRINIRRIQKDFDLMINKLDPDGVLKRPQRAC